MQSDIFKRIITTFADPGTSILVEKDRAMVQVYGDVIDVSLKQLSGEIIVMDAGNEMPANQWILNRLARLPLLADRLISTVPSTMPFVTPEADFLQTLEVSPEDEAKHVSDALSSTLGALDSRSPMETTVLYITSDAGEGKTCLINEIALTQAKRFKKHESDWLLVPIPLGGRHFLRFDDITVGALQNRYRFPYFYYDSFLELVRLGVLIPAFDGFEEMFVENSSGEAFSAMGILVRSLESRGAVVVAARKAYFELQGLDMQARLYDTTGSFSVEFEKLGLSRWERKQFLDYCGQRGLSNAESLYEKVLGRLGRQHSLITRPVLVRRLVDFSEGSTSLDSFLGNLDSSGADFFSFFVKGIVEREANEKWIDRSGEVAQPLLSVEEHCELLSQIALEMWQSRVDFLNAEVLEFVTDYFCESKKKSLNLAAQVRERIKTHALLVASTNARGAWEFDHDEFKQFFLGEGIATLCLNQGVSARSDLLNVLRKSTLPKQAFTALVQALKRLQTARRRQVIAMLAELASQEGQTSFAHENCISVVLALLSGVEGEHVVLRRMSFPLNALENIQISQVVFEDCFFAQSSLESSSLKDCEFLRCRFARLNVNGSTTITNVIMSDCTVDALHLIGRDSTLYEPDAMKSRLVKIGFILPNTGVEFPVEPLKLLEPDAEVVQIRKLLRYFMRSTNVSESVIHTRLGVQANSFFADTLPILMKRGILQEIEHRGGGDQRRFKPGRPMVVLRRAIEVCNGSFHRFLDEATGSNSGQ